MLLCDLPREILSHIGRYLDRRGRRSCILAARRLWAVCEPCVGHVIEVHAGAGATKLRNIDRAVAHVLGLMPGLKRVGLCFHGSCSADDPATERALRAAAGMLATRRVRLAVLTDFGTDAGAVGACLGAFIDEFTCWVHSRASVASVAKALGTLARRPRVNIVALDNGVGALLAHEDVLCRAGRVCLLFNGCTSRPWHLDLSKVPPDCRVDLVAMGDRQMPRTVEPGGKLARLGVCAADTAACFPEGADLSGLQQLDVCGVEGAGRMLERDDHPVYAFARAAACRWRAGGGGQALRVRVVVGTDPAVVAFCRRLRDALGGAASLEPAFCDGPDEYVVARITRALVPGMRPPTCYVERRMYEPPPELELPATGVRQLHAMLSREAQFRWFWAAGL